jgi:4-amino-4-deoxy-L-arabinose transferase-like glycosyltransferase
VLLFVGLGERDLWRPDEPRYGAIAEEMRSFVHGWRGLVLLHQHGEPYTQKPPLFFWLASLAGAPGGRVTEAAARLPAALGAFVTLLATTWLGRAMFGARAGVLAAALLLAVPSWLQLARSARLDALLTAFVSLAFFAAWRLERGLGDPRRGRLLLHAAIGLGVLTKGPVAALLPALGIAAFLAWERRLPEWRRFVSWEGLALSLAPGVAWLAAATWLAPGGGGFASASLWDNLILRFFAGAAHDEPVWFYLERLPVGFLPVSLLWPAVALRFRAAPPERARAWRFLLASVGATFVFLSCSAGKRGVYLLPIYPLLAIASAEPLAAWLVARGAVSRGLRGAFTGVALGTAAVGLAAPVVPEVEGVALPPSFGLAVAGGALAALASEPLLRRRVPPRLALCAATLALVLALEGAVFLRLLPALDPRNSARAVAELAAAATPAGAPIGVYRSESLSGAIAYYGRRPARILLEPADVAEFTAAGGRAIVVEDDDLERLHEVRAIRPLGEGRSRQRKLLVVTPVEGAAAALR